MTSSYPSWTEWLAGLLPAEQEAVQQLRQRFADLGSTDPESWARAEFGGDVAYLAKFILRRRMWKAILAWDQPGALEDMHHTRRLLDEGADRDTLATAMRAASFDAVTFVLGTIDQGTDWDAPADSPGWRLMESVDLEPTGRPVAGLLDDLMEHDPSGNEGEELWG